MRNPRRTRTILVTAMVVVDIAVVGGIVWYFVGKRGGKPAAAVPAPAAKTADLAAGAGAGTAGRVSRLDSVKPEVARATADKQDAGAIVQVQHTTTEPASTRPTEAPLPELEPLTAAPAGGASAEISAARALVEGGKWLEARQELDTLLRRKLSETDDEAVRGLLARVADETVFSRKAVRNDPLMETHVVEAGDKLIGIAREHDLPWEAVALVNGISNPNALRLGQTLKIPKGPFNVRVYKSKYRLDVYLGDLYLRSYRVGLGAEDGTPEGVWKVKDRLPNPRYYPSASAQDKRIIEPGDPNNPLGQYWIGLEGVEGAAVGHEGYGIHGTIDPNSIGKSVSLGCIRMHNEEVAVVFKLVTPGKSLVTILP